MEAPQRIVALLSTVAEVAPHPPHLSIPVDRFQKAAQDPKMFQDAMGLLKDPSAVAEAEKMMKDPEFASEINKQLAGLKQDPSFAQAMAAAQEKFKVLMADPAKMEEMMKQMQGLMGGAGEGGFDLEGAAALLGGGGAAAAAATGGDERKAGEGLADPEVD